jgi:hypothetical protein
MPPTVIRGGQVLDGSIQRTDLDTSTVGQAVVAKLIQGTNVTLSSTGADAGTGDVTINVPTGGTGPAGLNAFNITSGAFTVPNVGSTVTVTLNDASWVVIGQMVYVDGAGGVGQTGALQVTAKTGNQITLLNPAPAPAIPLASSSGAGLMATTDGNAAHFIGGDNASHAFPMASSSGAGLLATTSGTATDFIGGDNASHSHSTVPLDTLGATTDITARNATSSAHGLLAKVSGTATDFVGGDNASHPHSTIPLDTHGACTDITTLNATSTAHGLLAKLSGSTTDFVDGTNVCHQPSLNNLTSTAWTAFTAFLSAGAGTITTQGSTSAYLAIGKTIFFNIYLSCSNIGTASGGMSINGLPFPSKRPVVFFVRETSINGLGSSMTVGTGGTGGALSIASTNGNPAWVNNMSYAVMGVYEAQ